MCHLTDLVDEKRDQFTLKSSLKYGTEVHYDTSEESLQEFIQNLDAPAGAPATVSATRPGKVRTPRTPTRSITPLDEIKEERSDADTMSSDDSFKGSCSCLYLQSRNYHVHTLFHNTVHM